MHHKMQIEVAGIHCHPLRLRRGVEGSFSAASGWGGVGTLNMSLGGVYVLKMSKAGGSSFVGTLLQWSCDAYATDRAVSYTWSEFGGGLQAAAAAAAAGATRVSVGLLLREPTAHVLSMYHHCQNGNGMRLHNYTPISLSGWLDAWHGHDEHAHDGDSPLLRYCGYHPLNFQTSNLGGALVGLAGLGLRTGQRRRFLAQPGATLGRAVAAVHAAAFVGVTHRTREGLCVAVHTIYGKRCMISHLSISPMQARTRVNAQAVFPATVGVHAVAASTRACCISHTMSTTPRLTRSCSRRQRSRAFTR